MNMTNIFFVVPNAQISVLFKDCYFKKKSKQMLKAALTVADFSNVFQSHSAAAFYYHSPVSWVTPTQTPQFSQNQL